MQADWYLDYFQGLVVDLWQEAVPPAQTRAEADFVSELLQLPSGSRVLDVPCGFGRHSVELAARGYRVTGVDVSADCIGRARKLAGERAVIVEWNQAEMREIPQGELFDGALCLGNSFGYLDHAGTQTFLTRLSDALRCGARFIMDSGMVAESILPNLKPRLECQIGELEFVDEHAYLVAQSCLESTNTITRDGNVTVCRDWHFVFTLAEIHRMLAAAGFRVLDCYRSIDRQPYELRSEYLYLVAEKVGAS